MEAVVLGTSGDVIAPRDEKKSRPSSLSSFITLFSLAMSLSLHGSSFNAVEY
jgi:hypothetical protein